MISRPNWSNLGPVAPRLSRTSADDAGGATRLRVRVRFFRTGLGDAGGAAARDAAICDGRFAVFPRFTGSPNARAAAIAGSSAVGFRASRDVRAPAAPSVLARPPPPTLAPALRDVRSSAAVSSGDRGDRDRAEIDDSDDSDDDPPPCRGDRVAATPSVAARAPPFAPPLAHCSRTLTG